VVSIALTFKMTSLEHELKMCKDWLTKAGQFFNLIQQLKKLCSGNYTYIPLKRY